MVSGGFPDGSDSKASACDVGDPGSIPGLGRSLGEGNGNPLQDSWLENPVDRAAWQAIVHGGHKSVGQELATKLTTKKRGHKTIKLDQAAL